MNLRVGIALNEDLLIPDGSRRRQLVDRIAGAGLDHVTTGDHISFRDGTGFDGMIIAASVLSASERLEVLIGVYLAALRHPMVTARQLSTLTQLAPGRLVLGVGVGGDDRAEIANAGIDPAARGRRLDEVLALLRALSTGDPVDHEGRFYSLAGARIIPAPQPPVPLIVGGGGDAAIRRAARYGDGWLGIFCSSRRFADTVDRIKVATAELGRPEPSWFGLSLWCGLGADESRARAALGARMQALYGLSPDKFRHVTAAGTSEQVAEQLAGYVHAGARHLTLIMVADDPIESIDLAGEVRRQLDHEFAGD